MGMAFWGRLMSLENSLISCCSDVLAVSGFSAQLFRGIRWGEAFLPPQLTLLGRHGDQVRTDVGHLFLGVGSPNTAEDAQPSEELTAMIL